MLFLVFKMLKKISEYNYSHKIKVVFKNLDKTIKSIMKIGLSFCIILSLFALSILVTYNLYYTSPFLFYIGFSLFKLSLIFAVEFIICGFAVDKVKNELI